MELVEYSDQQQGNAQRLPPILNNNNRLNTGGTRYTLATSSIPHQLPPQNVLRANIDRQSGVIDTWPAHSSNQRPVNMQISLTKNNNLIITNSIAEGKPDLTPKPKFLENLEKFLERELKALRCDTNANPNETRLQAHREVFEYLIEEFKTYKPLLSAIKNEYELMLAHQREKIRELEPLKQMLVTLADQCDQKLMKFRDEERVQVKELKEERKQLLDLISQLKNDRLALQTQVDKLHDELALEHEKFRNESDKRKLLMADLNDMRYQQEEARKAELQREKKRAAEGLQADEGSQDDPVTLKIALKMCRQNLTDAMKRLTRMEADYNDVIPRRDYQALETVYKEIEARNEALEKDNKTLKTEYNTLKDHQKQLENKFHEAMNELENARHTNTPRPEWEMCTSLIDGGAERMRELLHDKSSVEMLEILLNELTGFSKDDTPPEYFNGKGLDKEVAPHLRYNGRLKNHNFTRREVCVLVNDIMRERHEYINSITAPESTDFMSLSEYIIGYFKTKYPTEEMAFEYSYSLNEALEKYPRNELIQLFSAALNFEVDEEMYHHERRVFKKLHELLVAEAATDANRDLENETISKEAFRDALKTFFRHKTADQLDDLVKAAEEELGSTESLRFEYQILFKEDPEGRFGQFLSKLRAQMREERSIFLNIIRDTIGAKLTLAPQELKRILHSLDESIPERDLDRILSWTFDEAKPIGIDEFNSKIERCCMHEHQFNLGEYLANKTLNR